MILSSLSEAKNVVQINIDSHSKQDETFSSPYENKQPTTVRKVIEINKLE